MSDITDDQLRAQLEEMSLRAQLQKYRILSEGHATSGALVALYEADNAALLAQLATAKEALSGLVNRLDEVNRDPGFKAVWTSYQAHGASYTGPTWVEALNKARAALVALAKAEKPT